VYAYRKSWLTHRLCRRSAIRPGGRFSKSSVTGRGPSERSRPAGFRSAGLPCRSISGVLKEAGLVTERQNGTAASLPRVDPDGPHRIARVPRRLLGRGARKTSRRRPNKRNRRKEVTVTATETIRKEIFVNAAPETAFRVFTEQTAAWWPLDKYGIYPRRRGDRWSSRTRDGWAG